MRAAWRQSAIVLVVLSTTGCDNRYPTAPTFSQPRANSQFPPSGPGGTLPVAMARRVGQWRGSSTVESTEGALPQCLAPFLRQGFTDTLSAEIRPFEAVLAMRIHQQASEACNVLVVASDGLIGGSPFSYDEFDCALVPSLCGLGCHFRLKSEEWNCQGPPPDVWILGTSLDGTFTDASMDRIQGTMKIDYAHSPVKSPPYTMMKVAMRFELRRDQ